MLSIHLIILKGKLVIWVLLKDKVVKIVVHSTGVNGLIGLGGD